LVRTRVADRRREREGAGRTATWHQRGNPPQTEREEYQRGSHAGVAAGTDRAPGVDDRRGARAGAAARRHPSTPTEEGYAVGRPCRSTTALARASRGTEN